MSTSRVAIITRTKNRNNLLERAMKSVLSQSFGEWTHIIINDGGDQRKVHELVEKYSPLYRGRLKLIHNERSEHMEAASDRAILSDRSEFIHIHDDDDSIHPKFLEETVSVLDAHRENPRMGGVVTHSVVINETYIDGIISETGRHLFRDLQQIDLFEMLSRNLFPPISFIFRRSCLEAIGHYNAFLEVLGDWDFNLRFFRHFDSIVLPLPLAYYHHRGNTTGDDSNSVIGGNANHRRTYTAMMNNGIRQAVSKEEISSLELQLLSKMFFELKDEVRALRTLINESKDGVEWTLRQHTNWLFSQHFGEKK